MVRRTFLEPSIHGEFRDDEFSSSQLYHHKDSLEHYSFVQSKQLHDLASLTPSPKSSPRSYIGGLVISHILENVKEGSNSILAPCYVMD